MTFFSILETLLIGPLKLIFEVVFDYANQFTFDPSIAIIYLSFIMNILVLPLYRRADAIQKETRDREAELHDNVAHIKKTFSGDERMMVLQTYYRQNHYKPTDSLRGSASLLLEIPFFIAAYQFLSHLDVLRNASLGPIKDLASPDGLLVFGGLTINLLPIIMTVINVISSAIYLKGFPAKTKIQLYGIAIIFFVFLYSSPSGLVFYWTMNNVFSLVKNIFYKLKDPKKVLAYLCYGIYFIIVGFGISSYFSESFVLRVVCLVISLLLPFFFLYLKKNVHFRKKKEVVQPNGKLFVLGTVFLTFLIGLLIPSAFIAASPQEYVDLVYYHNPLWYIVSAFCLASGTFLIWLRVFYWLANPKGKTIFDYAVWILCGVACVNYMFFGTDLGIISSVLQYESGMSFSLRQQMINLLVLVGLAVIMYLFARKWKRGAVTVLGILIVALSIMVSMNLVTIKKSVDKISVQENTERDMPSFRLSKTGNNVIVLVLDRAMGEYIPYLLNERPELKEQFSGFTYYENTISFGGYTNFGSPAIYGGYEYTPVEMNRRNTELLVSKHNEALKLMPAIFSENGYEVTVCDPVWANYQYIPDLSIYDDYPEVNTYITLGYFGDEWQKKISIENNTRNFFCVSMMKTMPLLFQPTLYNEGRYHHVVPDFLNITQVRYSTSTAIGMTSDFIEAYYALLNLSNMTEVTEEETDTFLMFYNDITHRPTLLQTPDYTPSQHVDNTVYDTENSGRFVIDGREMKMEEIEQISHYHANMAAMIQLGNWFDYLREHDVYDNTKIIIVADHGRDLKHFDELIFGDGSDKLKDVEYYYPLLMVKDFNSDEFIVSDDFMTNADVPVIATNNLIDNPINPFTGKAINSDEKYAHDQYILMSDSWDVFNNYENTFLPARWASVKDNLWDRDNWTFYEKEIVLDEYEFPKE